MDASEAERRATNLEKLSAYFTKHPTQWVDVTTLEDIAGRMAWRTRISECRTKLQMHIDNRQQRVRREDGSFAVISHYRYLPWDPLGPEAHTDRPRIQRDLPL